ncbi:MAG: M23 family metallopeptidase [Gemmatimonadota bacterium]|nr:M23 family metallopeptidase [Gemmatimonadota bacterium]
MTPRPRHVTIMVHAEGETSSRTFRVPMWAFRAVIAALLALLIVPALLLVLYAPLASAVVRAPFLEREVERLRAENAKVHELAAALDTAEARYATVRRMLGAEPLDAEADVQEAPPSVEGLPVAPALRVSAAGGRDFSSGPSDPIHWPLDEPGFLTRGQALAGQAGEAHPGVDIAVPVGTLVRAAGGGSAVEVGRDPEYGEFVLLEHRNGIRSMYGHLSRVLVAAGDTVAAGRVIGLSGNSGRSTAPHLHFEIRRGDRRVDPMSMVREGR